MLIERGVVSLVDEKTITVNCRSKIDCLRCAQGKGCGGGILARWLGDRQFSVKSFYDSSKQTPKLGDFVAIAIPANRIVKLAAITYGLPLLLLLIFLVFQVSFFSHMSELIVISLAAMVLFLGFNISSILVNKANASGLMLPTLIDHNSERQIFSPNCKKQSESI